MQRTMLRTVGLRQRFPRPAVFMSRANVLPHCSHLRQTSAAYSHASDTSRKNSQWQGRARSLFCAGLFVSIGLIYGFDLRKKMSQPPTPGTPEDTLDMKEIRSSLESLPVVAELRANPDFEELGANGGDELSEKEKSRYLTTGAMGGSRGVAVQKTFWNDKEKLAVSVVFFGTGLEGWPSFVHGGAVSTILDERLGRVALRMFPGGNGVTANLNINYRAPVISSNFYTVHAKYNSEKSSERKAFIEGTIRDFTGNTCIEATGLFVVPKSLKLDRLKEAD